MRHIDRGGEAGPAALDARDRANLTELERARAHQGKAAKKRNGKKESFEFAAYKADEVKRRLEELFHGKCAYCETYYSASAPVDVEHYRPKGAVSEDDKHPGYWWLAMAWDNLLPSCIDCNRKRKQIVVKPSTSVAELRTLGTTPDGRPIGSGKKDSFPIAADGARAQPELTILVNEHALLLDPCRDEPDDHLVFYDTKTGPLGVITAKGNPPSARGTASIHIFGLNRLGLVQERTRLLRQLEFLADLVVELASIVHEIEGREPDIARRLKLLHDRTLAEMAEMAKPDAPYSAVARAWFVEFKKRLA